MSVEGRGWGRVLASGRALASDRFCETGVFQLFMIKFYFCFVEEWNRTKSLHSCLVGEPYECRGK